MCHTWPCMKSKKLFQLQWKIKFIQFLVFELFLYDPCMISRKSYMVLVWLPRIHTTHIWPSMITKNHIWPSTKSMKVVWSLTRVTPDGRTSENVVCEREQILIAFDFSWTKTTKALAFFYLGIFRYFQSQTIVGIFGFRGKKLAVCLVFQIANPRKWT